MPFAALDFRRNRTAIAIGTAVLINLIRIVSSVTLTRILAPDVFGAIGVLISVAYVVTMVSDLGFQAFVVRHRDGEKPVFLDVIWTIRLVRSAALTLIVFGLAGPIAAALDKPELEPLIAISSLLLLVEGLSSMSFISAIRAGALGKLSLIEIGEAILQLILAISLSLYFRNAWGIIIAMILSRGMRVVASYAIFEDAGRRLSFDKAYLTELFAFGRFIAASSIITMLITQSDKIILSRLFTLETFGLYVLAASLAMAPAAFTPSYTNRVLYPVYAATAREHPDRLPGLFASAGQKVRLLYMLLVGGLIGLAPLIIEILYDPRYAGAATFMRLLAIAPLFALTNGMATEVLTASGRPQTNLHQNLVRVGWLATAGPIGYLNFGPIGIAGAVGTIEVAALLYSYFALGKAGLLRPKAELPGIAVAAVGLAAGLLATDAYFRFIAP